MWTLLGIALATPALDDLDAWEAILEAAENGPSGCWDVTGEVHWKLHGGGNLNEGRAPFSVRFEEHRFGDFTLYDPDITLKGAPGLDPDDLTLQFRPLVGWGPSHWLVDNDLGMFLRDHRQGEKSAWVDAEDGTLWVEPYGEDSVRVFRAEAIGERDRAPEATAFAVVPPGWEHAERLVFGREPHMQKGNGAQHRASNHVAFDREGFPALEQRRTEFRHLAVLRSFIEHDITYDTWAPCGETTPADGGTVVRRSDAIPVVTPTSDRLLPTLTAAVAPEHEAKRMELLWMAANDRREVRRNLVWGGIVGATWAAGALLMPVVQDEPVTPEQLGILHATAGASLAIQLGSAAFHEQRARKRIRAAESLTR